MLTFSRLVLTTHCKLFVDNKSFTCNGDGEVYIKLQYLTFGSNSDLFIFLAFLGIEEIGQEM